MKHIIELVGGMHDGHRMDDDPDNHVVSFTCDEGHQYVIGDEPCRLESLPEARVRLLHYIEEEV